MENAVRAVTSNQEDIYKNLEQVVRKYAATRFLRPVAEHTREAFERAKEFVQKIDKSKKGTIILDSGCGTGESTLHLAKRFPDIPIIGIDKSAMRLNKAGNIHQLEIVSSEKMDNAFWVRAELLDFWKLALEEVEAGRWNILHHAVYYPNPWPKESEATRRFHLHPIFPTLMALGNTIELRTNWEIYAREFAAAARIVRHDTAEVDCTPFDPILPETAFERKYKKARQQLWRVLVTKTCCPCD